MYGMTSIHGEIEDQHDAPTSCIRFA